MKPLDEILERINKAKDAYDILKLSQISEQSEILRSLSISYSDLNDHRVKAKETWDFHYFEHQGSNAAREKYADLKCSELYLLRRTMESTKVLIEAVRSTISAAKLDR